MWDTSNVVDMSYAFAFAKVKNLRIYDWNTKKLCYAEGMFKGSNFTEDISRWDLSSIKNKRNYPFN